MKLVIAFVLICGSVFATPTNPCDCPGTTAVFPLQDGESVVTCAGITGSYLNDFIDPNAFVAGVVDVRNPPLSCMGWNWAAPMYHDTCWTGNHLGQVFGIALDGSTPQNIYVSSTTVYGKYVTGGVDDPGRFGPSGPGAVYRINGVTGACTTCVVLPTHASLPGHGSVPSANEPSLGNICCDQANDILFATNFVDGKIYSFRCNEYLDEYDPFVAYSFPAQNDPATGFVILGERLWGIGVYQGRVYFSVWREDGGLNRQSAGANEIYSVSYNSSTGIIGSDIILEYIMPPIGGNYSNPVSDIEFKSGRMLLGERTMVGDIRPKGQNQGIWAHESRVKELIYNGTLWVASAHNFYTGNWTTRANCAGGVAYECMACDSGGWDVFSTGDALRFGSSLNAPLNGKDEYVYGIARIPCTGNQFVNSAGLDYVNTSNFYIDLDCITATSGDIDKTQPGDIDVAGLECDVAGAIHGKKWNDLNCNGIQELGEPGIAGWNITITKGSNTYTTMTGDSGKWWYMPLPPGNYNITEEIKPGWLACYPANGQWQVQLASNQHAENQNFGNQQLSCDSLEDPCIETPVGLVGWWPFSENSANPTATADIAGNNNGDRKNGAYSGCGVGPDFRGLGLDGINDYVEIPNSWVYLIQPNKSFMVDAWILAPPDVGDRMIIDKFSTSGFGIRLLLTGTGNLRGELRGSSGPVQGITFSPVQNLDDGNFHFVAMSLNRANNTLTLRADGLTNQLVLTPPGLIGGGSSLRIGAGRDAANLPIQFFEGCIDEVEFGRRDSSFEADLLEIYNQGVWESSPGKCKDACMVPWESFYCGNNSTLTTTLTICNYTNTPTLYSWWAEPVTTGPGCTGTPLAPNAFSPAAQQVTVPANKCMNYPITITEPSALPWGTACYKIHVMNMTNNTCCIAEGKVVDGKGIWIAPWNPLVDCIPTWPNQFIEFPTDCVRTVRFNIQNFFDSIGVLQYRLSVMPPEPGADIVSINGQAAGQIDSGTVFVTMGDTESVYIDANILFTDFGPLRAHDLLFDADIDHDGDFETLTSVALMNVSAYGVITAPTLTIWGDGGGVTLRWDGIPGAHHYVVFYSETDPAGPWIELGLTASTSFTDFFLIEDPPKRFYYVVAECAP